MKDRDPNNQLPGIQGDVQQQVKLLSELRQETEESLDLLKSPSLLGKSLSACERECRDSMEEMLALQMEGIASLADTAPNQPAFAGDWLEGFGFGEIAKIRSSVVELLNKVEGALMDEETGPQFSALLEDLKRQSLARLSKADDVLIQVLVITKSHREYVEMSLRSRYPLASLRIEEYRRYEEAVTELVKKFGIEWGKTLNACKEFAELVDIDDLKRFNDALEGYVSGEALDFGAAKSFFGRGAMRALEEKILRTQGPRSKSNEETGLNRVERQRRNLLNRTYADLRELMRGAKRGEGKRIVEEQWEEYCSKADKIGATTNTSLGSFRTGYYRWKKRIRPGILDILNLLGS